MAMETAMIRALQALAIFWAFIFPSADALGSKRLQGTALDFTRSFFDGSDPTTNSMATKLVEPGYPFVLEGFEEWFSTNANDTFNAIPTSIAFEDTGNGILEFGPPGSQFYPLDGLLYGNEGEPHNNFFTFTLDTIVSVTEPTNLIVSGTCTIFAGFCPVGGSSCTTSIDVRSTFTDTGGSNGGIISLNPGDFRVFVAYAHNCLAAPELRIQLPDVVEGQRQCDVTTAGIIEKGLYPFLSQNINRKNVIQTEAQRILLLDEIQQNVATSAWHPFQLDVRDGFLTSFRVTSTSNNPVASGFSGFAFMVQNDDAEAAGEAGRRHFETISSALAITFQWTENLGSLIVTARSNLNANGLIDIGTTTCTQVSTDFNVKISYIPEESSQLWITTDGCDDLSLIISDDDIRSSWNPRAWVGFTAGVSGVDSLGIQIQDWSVWHRQVSGTFSTIAGADIIWSQYGQHMATTNAVTSEFTRTTDIVRMNNINNGVLSFIAGESLASSRPPLLQFSPTSPNVQQVEVVYFVDETPGFQRIETQNDIVSETFSISLATTGVASGTAKQLLPSSMLPANPSYLLIPLDGCGSPVSTSQSLGLTTFAQTWNGPLFTTHLVTGINCSTGAVSVKFASNCGVDLTATVAGACDGGGQTPCALDLMIIPCDIAAMSWEMVFSASWECYDLAPPVITPTGMFAGTADEVTFGFHQEIYGVFYQERQAGNISSDIRFNGDSIGIFQAQFTFGPISELTSTFNPLGPLTLTAGIPVEIIIIARDQFGNNHSDPNSASNLAVSFDQVAAVFSAEHVDGNRFSISVTLTNVIENILMFVRVNSRDLVLSPVVISRVVANAPVQSSVGPQAVTQEASEDIGFTALITLQDAFGNQVTEGNVTVIASIAGIDGAILSSSMFNAMGQIEIPNIAFSQTGAFSVVYELNSTQIGTTTLTITPTDASVANFTIESSGANYQVDGDANFVLVQTRDQFGNERVTPASNSFSVEFVGPTTTLITVCPSATCLLLTGGRYRASFNPRQSGNWSIQAFDMGQNSSSFVVSVRAGSISAQSQLEILNFTARADEAAFFVVTSRDIENNLRSEVTTDGDTFTATIQQVGTGILVPSTVTSIGNGSYLFRWITAFPNCAGNYLITVTSPPANAEIQNLTSRTVTIIPADTTQIGNILGEGAAGGLEGEFATFTFQALDEFNNLQLNNISDKFTVGSDEPVNGVVIPTVPPLYTVNYTVPVFNPSSPQFVLLIFLNNSSPGVLVQQLMPTTLQSDNSPNGATATNLAMVLDPDVPEIFQINNLGLNGTQLATSRTFQVIFFNASSNSMDATPVNALVPTCTSNVEISPGFTGCNVTVNTPAIKHITTEGNYTLTLRVGADNTSPNNYSIVVIPGSTDGQSSTTSLEASNVVAGNSVGLFAVIMDAYGNTYKMGLRNVSFLVTAPQQENMEIPGVFNFALNRYEAVFTPQIAAVYRIVARENEILELGNFQTLTVIAGAAAAANSSIISVAPVNFGVFIAGEEFEAVVDLRDSFGNPVTGEMTSTPFSFIASLQKNIFPLNDIVELPIQGTYRITVVPNVSSIFPATGPAERLNFSVQIGGFDIGMSPRGIEIEPGNIDPVQSFTTPPIPANLTAGEYNSIIITLRDRFGNNWKQSTLLLRITISVPGSSFSSITNGPGQNFLTPTTLGEGRYNYTYRVLQANGFASYTFEYVSALFNNFTSVVINAFDQETYIFAGPPEASQTIITKQTSTFPDLNNDTSPFSANFTAFTNIQLFDAFGNARFANSTGVANITVRFDGHRTNDFIDSTLPTPFICTAAEDNFIQNFPEFDATNEFSTNVTCRDSDCVIITRGVRAGNYRQLIFVNGIGAACYQFTVLEEPVDPSGSRTVTVGSLNAAGTMCLQASNVLNLIVGTQQCIVVQLADAFGNFLRTNTSLPVSIGNPTDTQFCSNIVEESEIFNVTVPSTYIQNGQYIVPFSAERVGSFNISATVGGLSVGFDVDTACTPIAFRNSFVFEFSPNVTNILGIVGSPITVSITAFDIFGNLVTVGDFFYEMSLSHNQRDYVVNSGRSERVGTTDVLSFEVEWDGNYSAVITLTDNEFSGVEFPRLDQGNQIGFSYLASVLAGNQICAALDQALQYRCNDDPLSGICVNSYALCPSMQVTVCPVNQPIACPADGSCVAGITSCPCLNGGVRCGNGICVDFASECTDNILECPVGFVQCSQVDPLSYTQCAPSMEECPSPRVCPPGTFICDDGSSCASNTTRCPNVAIRDSGPATCPSGSYRCHDNICRSNAFDCPTRPSCGAGRVVCADGSCQDSLLACPSVYRCLDGFIRCQDGTCASRIEECPSQVSCPPGLVLCESNTCAESLSSCEIPQRCTLSQIRCADGTCTENVEHCPTQTSCHGTDRPVLCDDGTCRERADQCRRPSMLTDCQDIYNDESIVTCPDGSCASDFSRCPTGITCPSSRPIRCPDGSCQTNTAACQSLHQRNPCPSDISVSCPDGSCRYDITQCPSQYQCPPLLPIKCEDGSCVSSRSNCEVVSTLMDCPDGLIRCPGLGCAPTLETCPSAIACPRVNSVLLQRCPDGTCRENCSTVAYRGCATTEVTCPSALTGFPSCASELSNCPTYHSCPVDTPVLCLDGTCSFNASFCPDWPEEFIRVPCPGGGWELSVVGCGTPVSCPPQAPYKCLDETCRRLPGDCPEPPQCPSDQPYRCSNGDCFASVEDCASTTSCPNPQNFPVKCAALNISSLNDGTNIRCTSSVFSCDDPFQDSLSSTNLLLDCPNRWSHCRDSSCVDDTASLCDPIRCPDYLPFLCLGGLCAPNAGSCPDINGCPFDRPVKCEDGECVSRISQCNQNITSCDDGLVSCPDGSCSSPGSCPLANGCSSSTEIRCLDGSCVTFDEFALTPGINFCTSGQVQDDYNNACPPFQPFRCEGGLCAASESLCPQVAYDVVKPVCPEVEILVDGVFSIKRFSVLCTDGSCVDSEVQCPTLHACTSGLVRCDDGSCRPDINLCPRINTCPSELPVRCPNGACALSLESCVSPTSETGCPCSPIGIVNDEGFCDREQEKCSSTILGGLCGPSSSCENLEDAYSRPNGCNTTHPVKCEASGRCVTSDINCPLSNGCPQQLPVRCVDGTCQTVASLCTGNTPPNQLACAGGGFYDELIAGSASQCLTSSFCPVSSPYTCADGSCRKYQAFEIPIGLDADTRIVIENDFSTLACSGVLVCAADEPYRCADYSCAASPGDCPPTHRCPDPGRQFICPDLTCAETPESCSNSAGSRLNETRACPVNSPILCPDGSCRKELAYCLSERVGAPSCAANQIACFDGSCRSSAQECIRFAFLVGNPTMTAQNYDSLSLNADSEICAPEGNTQMAVCPDGECVPLVLRDTLCSALPKCPDAYPMRCPNSTCVTLESGCGDALAISTCDDPSLVRCADGSCRGSCAPSNGCGGETPYYCPIEFTPSSVCVPSAAICALIVETGEVQSFISKSTIITSVIPQGFLDGASSELNEEQIFIALPSNTPPLCMENCNRDVPATTQSILLNENVDVEIDIAVSPLDFSVRGSLIIPGGSTSRFEVDAVSDSELRAAVAYIHQSRQNQFSGRPGNFFTADQTVISPAFRCQASTDPFNFEIEYRARVDNSDLIQQEDICLAALIPSSQSWVCVAEFLGPRVQEPIANLSETRFNGIASGFFQTCLDEESGEPLILAFAHIPRQIELSDGDENLFYLIQIIAVLAVVGGMALVLLVLWFTQRVRRYRMKMKMVQKKAEEIEENIVDMKVYGGGLGQAGKDEEINMYANPMVVKFKSLEDQLREYKETTGYYETESKKQNAQINKLKIQQNKLNDAVRKLKMQLEEQRHRVLAQKRLREKKLANKLSESQTRALEEEEEASKPKEYERSEIVQEDSDEDDDVNLAREEV